MTHPFTLTCLTNILSTMASTTSPRPTASATSSTTSPTTTPSALTSSIDAAYHHFMHNEVLYKKYIHDTARLQSRLRLLVKVLNLTWSELNKTQQKPASLKDKMTQLRTVSRRLAELADGSRRGPNATVQDNVMANAAWETHLIAGKVKETIEREKELELMTRQEMVEEIKKKNKVDVDAEGFDFAVEVAKVWDQFAERLRKLETYIRVQGGKLEGDLKTCLKMFELLDVQTEEGGYYPSLYETNITRHLEAIEGRDCLEQIEKLIKYIDHSLVKPDGFIMVFSNNRNLPNEIPPLW
ncbi:hypothetical protein GE09DRAFT_1226398 [Coniochaeta sp. 2T2.1]|nr:hypothetical protein GE09DRAFT_1226398 [Coniochaeta sp. 2T2.1]